MPSGRNKKDQLLFDEIGEEEYNKLLKERKKERDKEYRDNNKEYYNKYYEDNKERLSIKNKEYRETQKEKIVLQNKKYRDDNKEKIKEKKKAYSITPEGIKNKVKDSWKRQNITFGNTTPSGYYDNVFLPTTRCHSCNKEFNNKRDKCLDHIHLPLFCNVRGVICCSCNYNDAWLYRAHPKSIYSSPFYKQQHEIYIIEMKREYTIQNHLDLD